MIKHIIGTDSKENVLKRLNAWWQAFQPIINAALSQDMPISEQEILYKELQEALVVANHCRAEQSFYDSIHKYLEKIRVYSKKYEKQLKGDLWEIW